MDDPDQLAEAAFAQAMALPANERAAAMEDICAGNTVLIQQVNELLRAHDEAGAFLENRPFVAGLQAPAPKPEGELPGDTIGHYKLLQQIGEGGFGTVWMAEQSEPVRRRVALKIIKLGMDTKEIVARFEQERQALAMMDHPNIAKVFDAGATPLGRPYFVMELVRGIKITDYCDQASLPTVERLHLFIAVCQAVQHAHQKGIIHRDLKPSNILVTLHDGVPVPKVIDFGVAKALHGRLTDKTLFTRFEQMIGTPLYMSPEQAELSGLDIDTRSDIYSLGVLLYELLTGRTPVDAETLRRAGLDEIRRIIREQEPPRPSTAVQTMAGDALTGTARHRGTEPPRLIGLLRGDLDWIVMKALEKDRARRYDTATALAEDLRRHLHDEPVSAGPPNVSYQLGKFARRHKAILTTAAAAWAVITALAVWFVININHERKVAIGERNHAVQAEQRRVAGERQRLADRKQFAPALAEAARLLIARRDFEAARVSVEQAVEYDPALVSALGLKAALLAEKEDYAGAAAVLANAAGDDARLARLRELCRGADTDHRPDSKALGEVFEALDLPSLAASYFTRAGAQTKAALAKIEAAWPKSASVCRVLPSGKLSVNLAGRSDVTDLSPLSGLPIEVLQLTSTNVKDLTPLKGMALRAIFLHGTGVSDLSPLRGMPLTLVSIQGTAIRDLGPLTDAPLNELIAINSAVTDLSPLRQTPLTILRVDLCQLRTLEPLRGKRLVTLIAQHTGITDLAPLAGMPLTELDIRGNRVASLAPLAGMKLNNLWLSDTQVRRRQQIKVAT